MEIPPKAWQDARSSKTKRLLSGSLKSLQPPKQIIVFGGFTITKRKIKQPEIF